MNIFNEQITSVVYTSLVHLTRLTKIPILKNCVTEKVYLGCREQYNFFVYGIPVLYLTLKLERWFRLSAAWISLDLTRTKNI